MRLKQQLQKKQKTITNLMQQGKNDSACRDMAKATGEAVGSFTDPDGRGVVPEAGENMTALEERKHQVRVQALECALTQEKTKCAGDSNCTLGIDVTKAIALKQHDL